MSPRRPSVTTLLARIRGYDFASRSDSDLRLALQSIRSRAGGEAPDDLLPEAFAIVAESIDRRLGAWRLFHEPLPEEVLDDGDGTVAETVVSVAEQRRYRHPGDIMLPSGFYNAASSQDVKGNLRFRPTAEQLLAAIHLFRGRVVQMDAGEGKTVAIAIAAVLHSSLGRRVHVITANDYLAERDAALLGPVYRSLGISSGAVPAHMEEAERRHVYRRNIVYGAMRELGFDHLRDNLKSAVPDRVQQLLEVAIVDEADHALIDEAFTPLIISGNPVRGTRTPVRVNSATAEMIDAQRGQAKALAAGLDSHPAGTPALRSLAATLLLADPDNPALLQRFADGPALRRRAGTLAEDDHGALAADLYYAVHPGRHQVTLTDRGREFLEQRLGTVFGELGSRVENLHKADGRLLRSLSAARREARRHGLANQVSQALRAHLLLQRDVDYLVDEDGIVLIDPHTGRPKPDSIYQQGLQAAVEAREGVAVQPERETLAQISVSGFASRYRQVAGITGTAVPAAGEFWRKYGLEVAVVAPAHPPNRVIREPVVYLTREEKQAAVAEEVEARHRTGQPVLLGTRTVEQSEEFSRLLNARGVPHGVLNAVTTHSEADIVREAGALGAVTVATHMAGRGTDILLQPDLDARVASRCAAEIHGLLTSEAAGIGLVEVSCPGTSQAEMLESELAIFDDLSIHRAAGGCGLEARRREHTQVHSGRATLGFALGLCVIGTEVHDSSRIALQLSGRSGRQGQFGLTQTFLSLEDRLVSVDAEGILKLRGCHRTDAAGRVFYTGPEVSRRIQALQDAADREGEAQRALMLDYVAEFDRQTDLYHRQREDVIAGGAGNSPEVKDLRRGVVDRAASRLAARHLGDDVDNDYPLRFKRLQEELDRDYSVDCSVLYGSDLAFLPSEVSSLLAQRLDEQAARSGSEFFLELARLLYLQVCSELWPGHIDALRDSVAVELLGALSHKSSVASHIRRCNEEWHRFREIVDEEFLSRLCTMQLPVPVDPSPAPVTISSETELLLSRHLLPDANEG